MFLVVPQPVYMNMNDLAMLAKQKQQENQEELDLKTPTAEDQHQLPVPDQKVKVFFSR